MSETHCVLSCHLPPLLPATITPWEAKLLTWFFSAGFGQVLGITFLPDVGCRRWTTSASPLLRRLSPHLFICLPLVPHSFNSTRPGFEPLSVPVEYEVKWTLGNITTNKAIGCDGTPDELFQILKDDAVKVRTQYASKFGKLSSGHRRSEELV